MTADQLFKFFLDSGVGQLNRPSDFWHVEIGGYHYHLILFKKLLFFLLPELTADKVINVTWKDLFEKLKTSLNGPVDFKELSETGLYTPVYPQL